MWPTPGPEGARPSRRPGAPSAWRSRSGRAACTHTPATPATRSAGPARASSSVRAAGAPATVSALGAGEQESGGLGALRQGPGLSGTGPGSQAAWSWENPSPSRTSWQSLPSHRKPSLSGRDSQSGCELFSSLAAGRFPLRGRQPLPCGPRAVQGLAAQTGTGQRHCASLRVTRATSHRFFLGKSDLM